MIRLCTSAWRTINPGLVRSLLFCGFAAAAFGLSSAAVQAANQPPQAKAGPGGANYIAGEVVKRAVGSFETPTIIFHAGPATSPRPVVIFLHAWGAANPQLYGGWIEHLARRGNLVLWPRFQDPNRVRIQDGMGNVLLALKQAFVDLAGDADARPDLSRVVVVGHLTGGIMAMNVAAMAAENNLPAPKLVMSLMAGGIARDAKARGIMLADLSQIPAQTLMMTMIGDRDHLPSDRVARLFLREATGVPASRKLFMRVASDDHGFPSLSATLAAPAAPKEGYDLAKIKLPPQPPRDPKAPRKSWRWSADMALSGEQTLLVAQINNNATDAMDYQGFWRVLDMGMEAAFAGQDAVAMRANPRLIDMGQWSNGWPMKRMSADVAREVAPAGPSPTATGTAPAPRRP